MEALPFNMKNLTQTNEGDYELLDSSQTSIYDIVWKKKMLQINKSSLEMDKVHADTKTQKNILSDYYSSKGDVPKTTW